MGVLDVLRGWLRSLLGRETGGGVPDADATAEETARPAYTCAVCGTPVEEPGAACPLCRSTDAVPADGERDPGEDGPPERNAVRRETRPDESRTVDDVLGSSDVLAAYDQHWERAESGYRVSLPDGRTKRVESTEAVRGALFRAYGPPDEE